MVFKHSERVLNIKGGHLLPSLCILFSETYGGACAGICGKWEDDDEPSSPLSCASTTAAFSDDAIELEGDVNSYVEVMEVMEVMEQECLELDGNDLRETDDDADQKATEVSVADIHESKRSGTATGRVHASEKDADAVKVELSLDAAHVVRGPPIVVHQEQAETLTEIMPSDAAEPRLFIPIPEIKPSSAKSRMPTQQTAAVRAGQTAQKRAPKRKLVSITLSDEEMIASLAGCASGPTTPAAHIGEGSLAAMSDSDLMVALAADAFPSSQPEPFDAEGMSDEELAAALAGCAGQDTKDDGSKDRHGLPCPDLEHWNHSSSCYDEVSHDDGVLEMALFDSSE